MPKQSVDQLTTQWVFQDSYDYKEKILPSSVVSKYAKALVDVAGADGLITDVERKWILGFAAAHGE